MSVLTGAENVVKKPVSWFRANHWVFLIVLFLVVVLVFRFRDAIAKGFAKMASWPIVGRPIAFLTGVQNNNAPPATPAT
jgi:hypothetical protein